MKTLQIFLFLFSIIEVFAQNPMPGSMNSKVLLIKNGEVHMGNGQVKMADILIENGIIKQIAPGITDANAQIISAEGKKIYPGIISPASQLGLVEIEAVRTTIDHSELGDINPSVRAQIAYNTDSELIPTVRGNGVLIGQVTPTGGTLSGRSGIVNYDGWNWEDALLKGEDGLWLNWPSKIRNSYNWMEGKRERTENERYTHTIANLKRLFAESRTYGEGSSAAKTNQNLAAIANLWSTEMKLYVQVDGAKEIMDVISFLRETEVENAVLVGVEGVLDVVSFVKEAKLPILIPGTHRLPSRTDEDVWQPYKLPSILWKEGILVGMYYNESSWRTRNLPFVAGTAAAYGLSPEEALQLITLNNAKILGIDKQVGSIEEGKHATLFISEGDALDMATSKVTHAFIKGAAIDLDDKQKRLYRKYMDKYELKDK